MSKIVAIIGGILGILASILFFFESFLGWWEVIYDPILGSNVRGDLNPFGTFIYGTNPAENWGTLFLLSGILFLASSVIIVCTVVKASRGGSVLCAVLMIVGIALFIYALNSQEGLQQIEDFLEFWGSEYNVYFGTADLGLLGIWTWRLGNGFFIAVVAAVIALIGSFMVKGE